MHLTICRQVHWGIAFLSRKQIVYYKNVCNIWNLKLNMYIYELHTYTVHNQLAFTILRVAFIEKSQDSRTCKAALSGVITMSTAWVRSENVVRAACSRRRSTSCRHICVIEKWCFHHSRKINQMQYIIFDTNSLLQTDTWKI